MNAQVTEHNTLYSHAITHRGITAVIMVTDETNEQDTFNGENEYVTYVRYITPQGPLTNPTPEQISAKCELYDYKVKPHIFWFNAHRDEHDHFGADLVIRVLG